MTHRRISRCRSWSQFGRAPWNQVLFTVIGISIIACNRSEDLQQDESLGVVVAADRRLAGEERDLLARRGVLQRSRSSVRDKRAELLGRKLALGAEDAFAKQAIEKEETELVQLEARLVQQELNLNKKLDDLLERKSGLVAKLGAEDGPTKGLLLARREYSIAQRERDVAHRESELSDREKSLAEREQGLAERQAKLCPGTRTTVVHAAPLSAPTKGYSRGDIEPLYRNALATMRTRGILTADLPAGLDRLVTDTRHAVARGEYDKAKYAVDQLLAALRAVSIDRNFIAGKIDRLARTIRQAPPRGERKREIEQLFQQATAHYGDGRFSAANGKLNEIYAKLR